MYVILWAINIVIFFVIFFVLFAIFKNILLPNEYSGGDDREPTVMTSPQF